MVCKITCAIALAFLGGMFWIQYTAHKGTLNALKNSLDDNQKIVYHNIALTRAKIWMTGLIAGFVVAGLWWWKYGRGNGFLMTRSCTFAAIVMTVNYFWYMLSPKGTYLIQHLHPHQVDEWLTVKVMMQSKYHIGMLLGIAGCVLVGLGLNK